jgi:hypothetical protein
MVVANMRFISNGCRHPRVLSRIGHSTRVGAAQDDLSRSSAEISALRRSRLLQSHRLVSCPCEGTASRTISPLKGWLELRETGAQRALASGKVLHWPLNASEVCAGQHIQSGSLTGDEVLEFVFRVHTLPFSRIRLVTSTA